MTQDHHISNEKAIFTLWLNWTIAVGALAMPEFGALFVPRSWIPIVTFACMFLLIIYKNTGRKFQTSSCDLIQSICVRTLCLSAIIMILIGIIYARHIISLFYPEELLNMDIPYLTILILGPVATAVCGYAMFQGHNAKVCRQCIIRYGTASERGFLGKIFLQESRYQVHFLFVLSFALTLIGWTYYWLFYINVNLNTPDRFILNWVPTIFFLFSAVFFGLRYFALWGYYYNHIELNPHAVINGTGIRYLILCGDNIYLSHKDEFYDTPDGNKYDTPVTLTLSQRVKIRKENAEEHFNNITGFISDDYSLRFMYKSADLSGLAHVYHFICCFPSKECLENTPVKGEWVSLSQLQRLLYNHDLSPALASEIHRLYTVTMAWKTYDIEGRRLYKIKNYRPAFRLKGICDWDVDFNNSQWLDVARFNEDKPLFRIRSLFRGHRRNNGSVGMSKE